MFRGEHRGRLELIREGTAYLTINFPDVVVYAEIDEAEMTKYGISEGDRFQINITENDITFELIPRRELTKADMDRIDAELNEALPDELLNLEEF
jgi:hypothetical protein